MFCSNCGKEIEDNEIFCKYCGTKLDVRNGNTNTKSNEPLITENKNDEISLFEQLLQIKDNVLSSYKNKKYW